MDTSLGVAPGVRVGVSSYAEIMWYHSDNKGIYSVGRSEKIIPKLKIMSDNRKPKTVIATWN